jgi:hypothetical protein
MLEREKILLITLARLRVFRHGPGVELAGARLAWVSFQAVVFDRE